MLGNFKFVVKEELRIKGEVVHRAVRQEEGYYKVYWEKDGEEFDTNYEIVTVEGFLAEGAWEIVEE